VASAGLDLLGAIVPPLDSTADWLVGIAVVPLALINVVFAIKLLRLPDSLYGMLPPLGLIGSAVSYVILGIVFLRAAGATATGSSGGFN